MKPPLTKVQANELHDLAKRINEREETIQALRGKTDEAARITVTEAILQGQDLIAAKAKLPHGMWLPWLKSHCPAVKDRQANNYMKLASNPQRCGFAESIRAALLICDDEPDGRGDGKPKVYLPYMQTLYLFTRAVKFIGSHPLQDCPEETRDELRKELHPVAVELWPDRFAA